jgi:hypothetical protein
VRSVFRSTFVAGVVFALLPAALWGLDLTVGSGAAQNCPAPAAGVSFSAAAIAYVEPGPVVTVNDYGGGHYSPSQGNNIGIGVGYAELTGAVAGFCIDALYRAEYRGDASRDLLDALVANHFGASFDTGRTYRLSLSDNSFKASGLRLRRVADFEFTDEWSARLGVGASLLKGLSGQQETLAGSAVATSGSYAVGTATWLKTDTNLNLADFNPFVAPGTPEGYGFSTDFEFLAQSKAGYSIDFIVMDALGRLYWHDVPQSYRILDNSTITYNADFNRNAFITGLDSRQSFVQTLPTIYRLAATVPVVSRFSAVIADDVISGFHFPSMGVQYGEHGRFGTLDFDFRTHSVSIGAGLPFLSAVVTSNSLRPGSATVLGIALRASHAW